MRKTGICTKCQHPYLLQILAMPDETTDRMYPRPMKLALHHDGVSWLGVEKSHGIGDLTAYMCRKCGYAELYVKEPEAIVPDGKYIVEYSAPNTKGPFR